MAITLQIPADPRYAAVAADAAEKYVELMGGAAAEGAAFAAALGDTARALAARASVPVTVVFSLQPSGVEAVVTAGSSAPAVVRQPIAAGKR